MKKNSMAPQSEQVQIYIERFPLEVQSKLQQIRQVIKEAAPNATEVISYQMPAYYEGKMLVYFAGYKHHIGLYPTPSGILPFLEELKPYKKSKAAVQFPIDKPLPLELIKKMVEYRRNEVLTKE